MPLSLHHIRGYMIPTWLITDAINLGCLDKVVYFRFLHCEVSTFSFHTLFLFHTLKEVTKSNPYSKDRKLCPTSWSRNIEIYYLKFLAKKDLSLIYNLFSYSITYLYQCGLMGIYFILLMINQYYCNLFCCSNYFSHCVSQSLGVLLG